MRDSIHKYFKIGTLQWMSYPPERYSLEESVRTLCADEYFTALEITHIPDEGMRERVKEMLKQSGITVSFGTQPQLLATKLNPNDVCEEGRQKAEAFLMELVDEAEEMGAEGISFMAGKWTPAQKERAWEQLLKTTKALCRYAGKKHMKVELELFDYDMDKAVLMGPAPYAAGFAAEVRKECDNFGLLVDLSHFPTTYETSEEVISVLHPYITHLHIGNAVVKKGMEAYGDQHPRFGFKGSANAEQEVVDFFSVFKKYDLLQEDDPFILSMEVKPREYEDAGIVIANTKRMINRAWEVLED